MHFNKQLHAHSFHIYLELYDNLCISLSWFAYLMPTFLLMNSLDSFSFL